MPDKSERLARLARAWDDAAAGYDAYFVPRFAPWVEATIAALEDADLPDGPILVPCCGTFPEAELLIEHFPDRRIAGIDLSDGMVARARRRVSPWSNVEVIVGDAARLDPRWSGECAAVVSVFGLQQLPDPGAAMRSWLDALRPGGRLSVAFWPGVTETDGPFALMSEVVRDRLPATGAQPDELAAMSLGDDVVLERDESLSYPMTHADASTFFDANTRSGPARALALAQGDTFIESLREEFLRRAPLGEWVHHPHARLIVANRPRTSQRQR